MKPLWLAICGSIFLCACGGGGGGVSVSQSNPTPPAALSVSISPSTQTSIDQGQTLKFTATVGNDSSAKGVTWSLSGTGISGAACGTFSDTSASAATYHAPSPVSASLNITVTATSVADPTKSASAVVVVDPAPSITTTSLASATPNTNYSTTLQATGGVGTLTWSLASGALPAGLSLSSAGVIAGDPTTSGSSTFSVQVADSSGANDGPDVAQAQFNLTVVGAVTISTTSLVTGSAGVAYLDAVDASGGAPPYTWSVASGSLPPGLTLQPGSGVISGVPTSQGSFTFAVEAQDSSAARQSQTKSLMIAIGAPASLSVTTSSLLDGTVDMPYTGKVAALGGVAPYTWKLAAGALPAGLSLDASTGTISGTPSATETANFSIQVTDSSSPNQTAEQQLSIAVDNPPEACASSGNNAVLSGTYAFSLSGYNATGFMTVVGSFTADGTGKITAGEADTNGVLGAQHGNILTASSSYSVGSDNRGCATLATAFGTFVTHFSLGSVSSNVATSGRLIEWDPPSASAYIAAGQLLRQTSAALAGSYVYRSIGWDFSALGGRDVCVGVLSAGGGTFSGVEQDCNDASAASNTAAPNLAGAYSSLDANGRGTGVIARGQDNSLITFYAVSSSQLLVVNADPGYAASGEWRQQSVPAGGSGFTQASLAGNLVFYLNGLSLNGTASAVSMETAKADGTSSMTIKFYADRAGVMQASGSFTCTYAVEPSGRVTLSSATQSCGSNPPVFYLTGQNTGFMVDATPGVDTGAFEPQSAGPFSNSSLTGNFFGGMAEVVIQSAQAEVDPVAPNGSGGITGTTDASSLSAQNAGGSFLAASYTVNADGTFSVSSSNGAVAGVVISGTKFVMFSPSTSATGCPTLLVMQK